MALYQGAALQAAEKLASRRVLRQGTTSQLAEKFFADGFVSGHDFSRAGRALFKFPGGL
jgi:hypothetical protein